MRVKVCGLTRAADVARCVELGATHLGFVLAAGTPRRVGAADARALAAEAGAATPVLVFRRAPLDEVLRAAEESGVARVQLHGFDERDALALEERGLVVHRVRAVAPGGAPDLAFAPAPRAERPWHLDVGAGGAGRAFDWGALGGRAPAHVFLAGGIGPDNVGALLAHEPWGIDLSSGVESRPGVKDHAALARLFEALAAAGGEEARR